MASGDTKTEALLNILGNGGDASKYDGSGNTKTQNYILDAIGRMESVEEEVEELKNNPDVVDIVATYADLQAYDKSKLTDNDIIRVLTDETHDGNSTYYRYSKSSKTFSYIGTSKQYSNFIGTNGYNVGVAGLVPAPIPTDAGKFLKADGTWDSAASKNYVDTFIQRKDYDPTPADTGYVGQIWEETNYGNLYVCTEDDGQGNYVWQTIGGGGGGSQSDPIDFTPDFKNGAPDAMQLYGYEGIPGQRGIWYRDDSGGQGRVFTFYEYVCVTSRKNSQTLETEYLWFKGNQQNYSWN